MTSSYRDLCLSIPIEVCYSVRPGVGSIVKLWAVSKIRGSLVSCNGVEVSILEVRVLLRSVVTQSLVYLLV